MNRDLCQICGRPVKLCQPSKNRVTGVPVGPYPTFDMAHIREIRPHGPRDQVCHRSATLAGRSAQWARAHLDADIHGGGPHGDEYRTTSVYFDNAAFDVFHRRGSFGRSKYRIRRYGDDETVFLERKMRQPAVLAKRRTTHAARGASTDLSTRERRYRIARLLVSSPGQSPGGSGRSARSRTRRMARSVLQGRRAGPPDARRRPAGAPGERGARFPTRPTCRPRRRCPAG